MIVQVDNKHNDGYGWKNFQTLGEDGRGIPDRFIDKNPLNSSED